MNKQHLSLRWQFAILTLTLFVFPLFAQVTVTVNRPDGIYSVGQTAYFQAKATYSTPATYEIIYDNKSPAVASGTINLVGGQDYSIPFSQNHAGVAICRVTLSNNGVVGEGAAVFSPLDIAPLEEEPADFDAFWQQQKNLKNSLPIDPQMAYHSESPYQTTYTFSLANIEGRRTYGFISVPKGTGPFPASITLPPYGSSTTVTGADTESAEKGGMIAVSISIHNRPIGQNDPNAYQPDVNSDRNKFYYRYGLIGAMHVIDYLQTRPDFDGNVCAMGVSQGAGLSILLAGIDDRVSLLINSNPTMGQHIGYKYDRASGFPFYLSIADDMNQGNQAAVDAVASATKYYDAMFHARRFKGASFTMTGLKDMVVPSETALASFNQLGGHKILMTTKDGGHEHPNEYWNGRFEVMRRYFQGSNNPPFQFGATNKGFEANAGADQTVGTSANLNGQIDYDNSNLSNLAVTWKKISGPGNVSFSNASGYSTSANFGSNGTYVLRFSGRDDRKMNSEGKVYYISDDVTVTVTGGGNPTYTLNLDCPANQTVQIPAGQNQMAVNWSSPTTSSNCAGGSSAFQISGPQNGSSFFEGSYTISYRATDNCGNQKDCNFTVTVNQEVVDNSDITLNCPSDIVVSASAGDNSVTVSWAEPTGSTTCNGGNTGGGGDCSSTFKSGYSYMGTNGNSQFYLSSGSSNWVQAKAAAESAGGRLPVITDDATNEFIRTNVNGEIIFIGVSDNGQEGNVQWVDGSSLGFNKFISNYNNSGDDFGVLFPWDGTWDLNGQFVAKKHVLEIPCSSGGGGSGVNLTQISGDGNGGNFAVGTTTVTYSATDDCGNSETCSFNVTVNATATNLNINCPSDISTTIPAGQSQTSVGWNPATASSSCSGGATVTQIAGNGNGSQFGAGTYTITYRATDNCGNSEDCSFTVNVSNTTTDLSINCPADRVFQIPAGQTQVQANWSTPTANSTCPGGATVTQTGGPGNFSQLGAGTYTIAYQATDNCGNTENCSFNVQVNQSATNLSINCPSNSTVQISAGQTLMALDWTNPTASTNCPGGATVNQISGTQKYNNVGPGTYNISYEATDNCGNRETCSFTVTLELATSNSDITINCPANIVRELPANQGSMSINWAIPTSSTTCTTGGGGGDCSGTFKNGFSYMGEFEGSQYYKSNNSFNFEKAKIEATSQGGNIAKVTSAAENEFIRANLGSTLAIIGCNDEETEGVFKWADGTDVSYSNFISNANNFAGDYAFMNFWDGKWELIPIYIYKPFILEVPCGGGGTGGVTVNQIAGPGNGASFSAGTSTITYQATDDCGNTKTCSFTITVNAPTATCTNISSGGAIDGYEENCGSFNPGRMNNTGGSLGSDVEYIWLKSESSCPSNINQQVSGATNDNYNPGNINTTTYYVRWARKVGCTEWRSSNCIQKKVNDCGNNNTDGPPSATLSVNSTTVNDDFEVTINFNEAVTSLSGYDLAITNASWYGFESSNGKDYTIILNPINEGNVTIRIPANVAFDSDINGNLATETITVVYQLGSTPEEPPVPNGSCLIQPTSVVIEDGYTVGGAVNNLINGNGLSAQDDIDAQHGGGNLYDGVWLNDGTDATLRFDLGQVKSIDGIALWNYSYHTWLVLKRRGVKDFLISTSTDGVNYSTTSYYTAGTTTRRGAEETVQVFNFSPVTTRYVRLRILGAIDDSFYVGLGEVRFTNNCESVSQFTANSRTSNNFDDGNNLFEEPLNAEVFPNPTSDFVFVSLNAGQHSEVSIEVINELGAIMSRQQLDRIDSEPVRINLFDYADGLYLIRISVEGEESILKKIVKSSR